MVDTVERQMIPEVEQFKRRVTEASRLLAGDHLALSSFYAEKETEARIFMMRTPSTKQRYDYRQAVEEMRNLARNHRWEGMRESMHGPQEGYGLGRSARRA